MRWPKRYPGTLEGRPRQRRTRDSRPLHRFSPSSPPTGCEKTRFTIEDQPSCGVFRLPRRRRIVVLEHIPPNDRSTPAPYRAANRRISAIDEASISASGRIVTESSEKSQEPYSCHRGRGQSYAGHAVRGVVPRASGESESRSPIAERVRLIVKGGPDRLSTFWAPLQEPGECRLPNGPA
jgi:hypothetical protein